MTRDHVALTVFILIIAAAFAAPVYFSTQALEAGKQHTNYTTK